MLVIWKKDRKKAFALSPRMIWTKPSLVLRCTGLDIFPHHSPGGIQIELTLPIHLYPPIIPEEGPHSIYIRPWAHPLLQQHACALPTTVSRAEWTLTHPPPLTPHSTLPSPTPHSPPPPRLSSPAGSAEYRPSPAFTLPDWNANYSSSERLVSVNDLSGESCLSELLLLPIRGRRRRVEM